MVYCSKSSFWTSQNMPICHSTKIASCFFVDNYAIRPKLHRASLWTILYISAKFCSFIYISAQIFAGVLNYGSGLISQFFLHFSRHCHITHLRIHQYITVHTSSNLYRDSKLWTRLIQPIILLFPIRSHITNCGYAHKKWPILLKSNRRILFRSQLSSMIY